MLAIDSVWGDRAASGDIGPAFRRGTVVEDCLFFEAIDAREETFRGRIGVWVEWEEELET